SPAFSDSRKRRWASASLYWSASDFFLHCGHPMKISAPKEKLRSPVQRRRLAERNFRPLALELGWLLYEWNRLHESLAEIFAAVLCPNESAVVALAVWHSARSDLAQREMLLAAVIATLTEKLDALKQSVADIPTPSVAAPVPLPQPSKARGK